MEFLQEIYPNLECDLKSAKRERIALQRIAKVELYDYSVSAFKDIYFDFNSDSTFKKHLENMCAIHKGKYEKRAKDKNNSVFDPGALLKKDINRKDLMRIVETWLDLTKKEGSANESDLEIIWMIINDFKSLVRCDSCKQFMLKCIKMVQEEGDPLFA